MSAKNYKFVVDENSLPDGPKYQLRSGDKSRNETDRDLLPQAVSGWPNPKQATDEKQLETAVGPNAVYSEHVVSSPETAYTENIASESDEEEKTTGFFYRCRT